MKRLFVLIALILVFMQQELANAQNNYASAQITEITPEKFSSFGIQYLSSYKDFKYGLYGIGSEWYNAKGWGLAYSYSVNYGIVPTATHMFLLGPLYGVPISNSILFNTSLQGMWFFSKEVDLNGGIFLSPGLRVKCNKIGLGISADFGWINKADDIYTGIRFSISWLNEN